MAMFGDPTSSWQYGYCQVHKQEVLRVQSGQSGLLFPAAAKNLDKLCGPSCLQFIW